MNTESRNVLSESELMTYALEEASRMGLKKSLSVMVDSQIPLDFYRSLEFTHVIRLASLSRSSLMHELGHAYMNEKFPQLYELFGRFNKTVDFLCEKLGWLGAAVYGMGFLGLPLLCGILSAFSGRPEIWLASFSIGIVTGIPFIDECMALYLGRKYRPAVNFSPKQTSTANIENDSRAAIR